MTTSLIKMTKEIKKSIEERIKQFFVSDLKTSAESLLNTLGYRSNKKAGIDLESLKARASDRNIESLSYALWDEWKSASLVFQITGDEIKQNASLFDFNVVAEDLMQSYLFFTIELKGSSYSRGQFSGITRYMNWLYDMPVMVIFKYESNLTFAIINRSPNIKETEKSVLEKITLIKDISIESPHRAHIEILFDLSINELQRKYGFSDFEGLHKAWQKTLDTKELNKQFYQKLFNWYLWALQQVKFPQMRPKEEIIADNVHQSESLIRLLTRLLFVWFMKEKKLINPDLFEQNKLKQILKDFKGEDGKDTIYYKAILQNLFFATLNRPIGQRKPIDKRKTKNPEYGDPLVYRYEDLYIKPENILKYFEDIPFLNGGLFDCLDQRRDADNPVEIRLDGFSTKKEKQPIIPDKLFFGEYNNIDLSTDYDDKKKNRLTVFGLIDILQQYKFTIEENTPVEEEVALDPELLGKVFENLLASYNPETQTTARKQTGSFYTPREIVNYMVDESLIAYLKNHVDDEPRLRKLFSYEECDCEVPFNKAETEILLKAIDSCKILDPACGSGAFPMGVLQKMIHILHKLDRDNSQWFEMVISNFPAYMQPEVRKKLEKENWNYVRKLGIIQQCIYGVDIQPIATQIAKLRFFISLLVDQKEKPGEDNRGYEPLPNLDFKIVTANTLIPAPASDEETTGLFAGQADPFFEELDKLTGLYFSKSDPADKKELKNRITRIIKEKCDQKIKQIESRFEHADEKASRALKEKHRKFIEEKEREVKLWKSYPNLFKYESVGFFESKYFFPKAKIGFDVVIGNPPYGILNKKQNKSESIVVSDDDLRYFTSSEYYRPSTGGMLNIFRLFILRSIRLLNQEGILSEIFPLAFTGDLSVKNLRKHILENTQILSIEAFPERDDQNKRVFEAVKMSVCILNLKNLKNDASFFLRINTDRYIDDFAEKNFLNQKIIKTLDAENLTIPLTSSIQTKLLLKIFKKGQRFREIGKCNTGEIDMTFCRKAFSDDNKNAILLKGAIIDRYLLREKMSQGEIVFIDEKKLLKIKHTIPEIRRVQRIVLQGITGINENIRLKMMIIKNAYCANSLNYLTINNDLNKKYLLGLFNSRLLNFIFSKFSTNSNVNGYEIDNLPICYNNRYDSPISSLVDYILSLKEQNIDSTFFEVLIDAMVYEVYLSKESKGNDFLIVENLSKLPELKEDWSDEKKLEVIDKVYRELSAPSHPVSVAMAKMQEIEEVKIIEGRG